MAVLVRENIVTYEDVKLGRSKTYRRDPGPLEPISGSITASIGALSDLTQGIGHLSVALGKRSYSRSNPSLEISPTRSSTPEAGTPTEISRTSTSSPKPGVDWSPSGSRTKKGWTRLAVGTKASIVDIPMALAQGMHNAPRLYGDTTVRENYKITGFGSGMGAAGKGLVFGLYDGVADLITLPAKGAAEGGVGGFAKGFGKAIGSTIFKPMAGISGAFAYPFKGIHKEIQKWGVRGDDKAIRRALIAQGDEELEGWTIESREEIIRRWKELDEKKERKERKEKGREKGREGKTVSTEGTRVPGDF